MEGQSHPGLEALFADMGWVYGLARSLVGDASTAEDVTQDTWIAALRRGPDAGPPPRSWLARVARNFARQRARSEGARASREQHVARPDEVPSADELAERMERQRLLADALTRLDEPYRSTVILRFSEELTPSEIARSLGLPPGTVRRRLKEGLDRLRVDLDRHFGSRPAWIAALQPFVQSGRGLGATAPAAASAVPGALLVMKAIWISAAVLACATGVLYLLPDDRPETAAQAQLAETSTTPTDPNALGASEAEEDAAPRAATTRSVAEATTSSTRGASTVRGRVALPPNTEVDPTLEVFALERPADYIDLVDMLDGDAGTQRILARGPVAADGSFAIALSGAAENLAACHLALRGRYLYVPQSVPAALGRGEVPITLTPELGAWVTGRVVATDGVAQAEAADARVHLLAQAGLAPTASMIWHVFESHQTADPNGEFEVRAVPVEHNYAGLASPDELAAGRFLVEHLAPLEHRVVQVPLGSGSDIHGMALDPMGTPVAGAEIEAMLPGRFFGFDDFRIRTTRSGSDGAFRLEHVPAGDLQLRADHDDHLESPRTHVTARPDVALRDVALTLGRGERLRGVVRWADGSAASDVLVRASFDRAFGTGSDNIHSLRGADGRAQTDAAGAFTLLGLGRGPFVLTVDEPGRPGSESDGPHRAQLDGVRPEGGDVELVLRPLQPLTGHVVDAAGMPVRAFALRASRVVEGAFGEMAFERHTETFESKDGAFSVAGLTAGTWLVSASSDTASTPVPARVELPRARGEAPLQLRMKRTTVVRGRVLAPDGKPRPGAVVRIESERPFWMFDVLAAPAPPSTTTDVHGEFELAGASGTVSLVADAEDAATSHPVRIELDAGRTTPNVELQLREGARLRGEVWSNGRPAADFVIHVEHSTSRHVEMAGTDEQGRFELRHLEPGYWGVAAIDAQSGADFSTETLQEAELIELLEFTSVTLEEGQTTEVVMGKAAANPIRVTGRIQRGGEPYARTSVTLLPSDGGSFDKLIFSRTDADGRYEAEVSEPGYYNISLPRFPDAPQGNTIDFAREIPSGVTEVQIDLELPDAGIAGHVLGPDGEPAPNVRVTLMQPDHRPTDEFSQSTYAEVLTNAAGEFAFPCLRDGSYVLAAGGAALDPSVPTRALARVYRADIEVEPNRWTRDVEFELEAAASVVIDVRDSGGAPVRGATLFVRNEYGTVVDPLSSASTDAAGRFEYGGLSEGDYTVFAHTWSQASAESEPVHVTAGEETVVQIVLQPAARLRVRLVDEIGRPLQGWFEVVDETGLSQNSAYSMPNIMRLLTEGAFSPSAPLFGPLPPGHYDIAADAFDGRSASESFTIHPGDTGEVECVLRVRAR